jgi:KaiC/GvpD/RAD55 family RecA-like ATPase
MRDAPAETLHWPEHAEQAALGACLANTSACTLVARTLPAEDFYRDRERRIMAAIARLEGEGREADVVTVAAQLGADPELRGYLHTLAEYVPSAANAAEYVAEVRAAAGRRRLRRGFRDALDALDNGNGQGELRCREIASQALEHEDLLAQRAARVPFVDWTTFWDAERSEAEWAFPDVLARGRGHAIYAAHKMGKSLLTLYMAAKLATAGEPFVVLYLDWEMSPSDVRERLEDMGYGLGSDLSRLLYALLPALPPLDTPEGAWALTALLDRVQKDWPEHHLVVVIDTIGRAVNGEENSADTFRAFYAHTGIELKRRGCTWLRLDHAGKASEQGQRGSSAKGDDVDLVWKLTKTENGLQLHRELARMSWVPEHVTFKMNESPLDFVRLASDWPTGTDELAYWLDKYGVDLDASASTAMTVLRDHDMRKRKQIVLAALRWRREKQAAS